MRDVNPRDGVGGGGGGGGGLGTGGERGTRLTFPGLVARSRRSLDLPGHCPPPPSGQLPVCVLCGEVSLCCMHPSTRIAMLGRRGEGGGDAFGVFSN